MFKWLRNKVKAFYISFIIRPLIRRAIEQGLERYIIVINTRQSVAYLRENLCTIYRDELNEIHYHTKEIR